MAIVHHEAAALERVATLATEEVAGMPRFAECVNDLQLKQPTTD
jgi:hypothetical protein